MNIFQWVINKIRWWFAKPLDNDVNTIKALVEMWRSSDMLMMQQTGIEYYRGYHDILTEQYDIIECYNRIAPDLKKRIVDNQYKRVVDQKNNYSFGKPFTIQHPDQEYSEQLNDVFTKVFKNTTRRITLDMINCGAAFGYIYYDEQGILNCERFKSWESIPVWEDEEHDTLKMLIHVVDVSYIKRGQRIEKYMYEVYEPDGVTCYDESYRLLTGKEPYVRVDGAGYNWEKLPIVQFKLNDSMTPLIKNVKTLQDALNLLESNYYNNVTANVRDTVFVLKGYPDEDLTKFYQNITELGVVSVQGDGDVTTLTIDTNPEAYKTLLKELKKAIVENAMSYWRDLDRLGTNVNQMNILSMYSDIDLDADSIEAEVLRAFDEILWFVNTHLGRPYDLIEDVTVTFNRNMLMNESETIKNINNSRGFISEQTLMQHHPWVANAPAEMLAVERQLKQKQQEMIVNGLNMDGTQVTISNNGTDNPNDTGIEEPKTSTQDTVTA